MNNQNSEEKARGGSQPALFQGDKCGNQLALEGPSAFIHTHWDARATRETCLHTLGADGERISLTNSCTKGLAGDESVYWEPAMRGEVPGGSWGSDKMGPLEPEFQCNSAQAPRGQPLVPGEWRYDCGDANGTADRMALSLEEGWHMKGEGQGVMEAPASLRSLPQPGLPCGQVTATLPSSEMGVRGMDSPSQGPGMPLGTPRQEPLETSNAEGQLLSDTAVADAESLRSSEMMPGALANSFEQEITRAEMPRAPGPCWEGLNGSSMPLAEKTSDSCKDRSTGEPASQAVCGPAMTPSWGRPEAERPGDGLPFKDPAEQPGQPGCPPSEMSSPDNTVGTGCQPVAALLVDGHPLGHEAAPAPGSKSQMMESVPGPSEVGVLLPAIPACPNETFSISPPKKAKEKPSEAEKSTQEPVKSTRKLAPSMGALGKVLGKPSPKPGTPAGSNLHKTEKISFPRRNFKNVKAKVISRAVLQPREPAVAAPGPGLPPGPPVAESPANSVPRKTERKGPSAKAEVLPAKSHRQHLHKLLTSPVVQVTTHSRSASHETPRASHGGGPRAGLAKAGRLLGSGAGAMGPQKGTEAPRSTMTTAEPALPGPRAPASNGASPEDEDGSMAVPLDVQEGRREVVTAPLACSPAMASTLKVPPGAGTDGSKQDPLALSKIPVSKRRVRPSVSCWRRSTESRNFRPERALSPQRTKRVSNSGASRKSVAPSLVAALSTVEKGKQRHPRTPNSQPQPSPDPLSTEKTLGLASYRAKCEHQGKVILHLRQLLVGGNRKLEALAVVIQHLLSQREEALKHHQAQSQELVSLRGELVTASATCEKLEKARNELQAACQAFVDKLNEQHQADLAELERQLKEHYTGECERLQSICMQEVQKYQAQLQSQVDDLNAAHEAIKLEIESSHSEQVDLLKKAYEASLTEIKECHDLEKKSLEETFSEKHGSLEKEIHDLKSKNDALNEKLKLEEQKAASREKANLKNPQIMYLERELESLKAVLEIKNEKLHQQDVKLIKMEKLVDNNTALVDKLKRVQQENEELKARMDKHMAISRQLSTEQAVLQESLEKESKVNKRLSMENEELLWKLHNGDLCSPKKSPPSAALPFSSPRNSASFPSPTGSPR